MRFIGIVLTLFFKIALFSQTPTCGGTTNFKILHFTKTNGFNHGTRNVSNAMFQEMGGQENFSVVNSQDASVFDDLAQLMAFQVIVFSNTSGSNLFNATQRANIEAYINNGGAFLGIHAATDTYRDGSWPFYNELVGGIVQSSPN
ncbi:MAG: ThuA domain-containing protein, partial [Bacteroidota bacterium]